MPITFVKVDINAGRVAQTLRNAVEKLRDVQEDVAYLKLATDNMTDGTDYATLAANTGVPVGSAAALKALIDGSNTALSTAAINNLIRNLG